MTQPGSNMQFWNGRPLIIQCSREWNLLPAVRVIRRYRGAWHCFDWLCFRINVRFALWT